MHALDLPANPTPRPLHIPTPSRQCDLRTGLSAPEMPVSTDSLPSGMWTPPPTPVRPEAHNALLGSDEKNIETKDAPDNCQNSLAVSTEEKMAWESIMPRPCGKKYQRLGSASTGHSDLGRGVWSTVCRATELFQPVSSPLLTPPVSPASSSGGLASKSMLAVKGPARRDAHNVLYQEARILTYLHSFRSAPNFLVPFHGYDEAFHSLVMDAVPLDLEQYIESCVKKARANFSTRTMFDPVCGTKQWQELILRLIDGLAFLHEAGCVHGDIKPANILLQRTSSEWSESDLLTPLYCDFSSSRILDNEPAPQVTAITNDFASPEYLVSLSSTTASDIYALGVTLLNAATGSSPYACARMEVQKLSMIREGRPIDFARQADQGTRVMKGRMVDGCLKAALEKNVDRRIEARDWKSHVHECFHGIP